MTQEAQFLAAEPDEPQLVQRVHVLHLLSDVQDRRGAGSIVEHALAVDRVQVRIDDQDVILVATLGFRDDVVVGEVRLDDRVNTRGS